MDKGAFKCLNEGKWDSSILKMPATADNKRLALIPFGKSTGVISRFVKERACQLRQSAPLGENAFMFAFSLIVSNR